MKVIDFIGLGAEKTVYVIMDGSSHVVWRGTRQDFIREMSAFFLLFYRTIHHFEVGAVDILILYI